MSDVPKSGLDEVYAERFDRGLLLKRAGRRRRRARACPVRRDHAGVRCETDDQDRLGRAADRSARELRRGEQVHRQRDAEPVQQGHPGGQEHVSDRDPAARLAVEREPGRDGRAKPDPRRQHRPDARQQHSAHDEPGLGRLRGERNAVHRRPTCRGRHGSSAARAIRRSRSSGRTTSSGASRTSSPSSWTCGRRCRRTRPSAPSTRTIPTAARGPTRSGLPAARSRRPATS